MTHYHHVTTWTRFLLALPLAFALGCDGGGSSAAGGDGGGDPIEQSDCMQTAACMADECTDEFEAYVRDCGCDADGSTCTYPGLTEQCDAALLATAVCFEACEVGDTKNGDEAFSQFRDCLAGTFEACDDSTLACEAAP